MRKVRGKQEMDILMRGKDNVCANYIRHFDVPLPGRSLSFSYRLQEICTLSCTYFAPSHRKDY